MAVPYCNYIFIFYVNLSCSEEINLIDFLSFGPPSTLVSLNLLGKQYLLLLKTWEEEKDIIDAMSFIALLIKFSLFQKQNLFEIIPED